MHLLDLQLVHARLVHPDLLFLHVDADADDDEEGSKKCVERNPVILFALFASRLILDLHAVAVGDVFLGVVAAAVLALRVVGALRHGVDQTDETRG